MDGMYGFESIEIHNQPQIRRLPVCDLRICGGITRYICNDFFKLIHNSMSGYNWYFLQRG
jgi:hypothetical protein